MDRHSLNPNLNRIGDQGEAPFPWLIYSQQEISDSCAQRGYFDMPGVGRLRPNGIGRRAVISWSVLNLIMWAILFTATSLRVKAYQNVAMNAHAHAERIQRASEEAAATQISQMTCQFKLDNFRTALNEEEKRLQPQAKDDTRAAGVLRLVRVMKGML